MPSSFTPDHRRARRPSAAGPRRRPVTSETTAPRPSSQLTTTAGLTEPRTRHRPRSRWPRTGARTTKLCPASPSSNGAKAHRAGRRFRRDARPARGGALTTDLSLQAPASGHQASHSVVGVLVADTRRAADRRGSRSRFEPCADAHERSLCGQPRRAGRRGWQATIPQRAATD
jgi:hypothetical protein